MTEAIRQRSYSVVLFDEMEKAHPDVMNLLLQILEDGRLTDSRGVTANFKNCIIIFTSNIGSELFLQQPQPADLNKKVIERLRSLVRPEFFNRIDSCIVFNTLSYDHYKNIIQLQLEKVIHTRIYSVYICLSRRMKNSAKETRRWNFKCQMK